MRGGRRRPDSHIRPNGGPVAGRAERARRRKRESPQNGVFQHRITLRGSIMMRVKMPHQELPQAIVLEQRTAQAVNIQNEVRVAILPRADPSPEGHAGQENEAAYRDSMRGTEN